MPDVAIAPADVLAFWRGVGRERWYARDDALDAEIRGRFLKLWEAGMAGALAAWEADDAGLLALIILFDQFPRNMFRGSARAFASDDKALRLAKRAIASGVAQRVDPALAAFVYLPLMHSERLDDQAKCVALFRAHGDAESLRYAEIHEDIIRRFGRFPHRNAALGRQTTADEQAYLDAGGFSG